jgi:tRNA dimethylallyltransferase
VSSGVLILTGQTASGKSALALELAERFGAEIVGADSRQIYRGMPVGTAAPAEADLARVPHHLIGFLDPHERYSAARFVADALAAIDAIHARRRRAIIVGGTGFYVRALTGGVALSSAYDPALRERLAREARIHPPEALAEWLRALAPQRAAAIAANDPYRITRALEIALVERGTGRLAERHDDRAVPGDDSAARGIDGARAAGNLRTRGIPFAKVYLDVAPDVLQGRIEARVDAMLANGLLEEAERVGADAVAADAVGYREALAYLAGWSTRAELRAQLVRGTRRYAKRQATWFRTEPGLVRVDAAGGLPRAVELAGALPGWA